MKKSRSSSSRPCVNLWFALDPRQLHNGTVPARIGLFKRDQCLHEAPIIGWHMTFDQVPAYPKPFRHRIPVHCIPPILDIRVALVLVLQGTSKHLPPLTIVSSPTQPHQ